MARTLSGWPSWGPTKPPPGAVLASAHPHAQGLVGAWVMAEGGGSLVQDLSGGNTARPGTAPTWGPGPHGAGTRYAGASSQYLTVGDVRALKLTGSLTVVAWVNLAASFASGFRNIAGKWNDSSPRSYTLAVGATGGAFDGLAWFVESTGTGLLSVTSTQAQSTFVGTWRQVVGVADTNLQQVRLYVDGHLSNSASGAPSVDDSTRAFQIGNHTSNTAFWDGGIESVLVYNRVLTATEIAALYVQPYPMFAPPVWRRYFVPVVTQTAVPISDVSAGTWTASTGTDLYAMVDETPASDSDYIQSATTPSADVAEVRVTSLTDPASSSGHVVRYRARKPS